MTRKMESKYPGKCKGVRIDPESGEGVVCGSAFEAGAKVYYNKDAGGVVGCPACKPELNAGAGTSTWVVTVTRIKMATSDFSVIEATVESVEGADREQWESIRSSDHGVVIEYSGGASTKAGSKRLTFVGPLGTSLRTGDQCRILGQLEQDNRGQPQCRAASPAVLEIVEGDEGVIAFLKRLSYVQDIRARALVAAFGSGPELWDALENNPELVAEKVSGITVERAQKIAAEYKQAAGIRDAYTALSGQALSPKIIARALEAWGKAAPRILKDSVYALIALDYSWADADRTALAQGYANDDPRRLAAIAFRLGATIMNTGSTWVDRDELLGPFRPAGSADGSPGNTLDAGNADTRSPYYRLLTESGMLTVQAAEQVISVGAARGLISPEVLARDDGKLRKLVKSPLCVSADDDTVIFPRHLAYLESGIATSLGRLSQASMRPWRALTEAELLAVTEGQTLAVEQLAAVEMVRTALVSVLTGGAGVGKTTVAKAIIRMAKANGGRVKVAAPTGKAAQVITQATGEQGTTVHRLLAPTGALDALDEDFEVDVSSSLVSSEPGEAAISADLLVCDESSFIDVEIGYALLGQIQSGCRLLFVGDVNQLPSVGPGAVLRDVIDSGVVPVTQLTKIFRTRDASPIQHIAADIRDGVQPEWPMGSNQLHVIDVRGAAGAAAGVNQQDAARWTADNVVKLVTDRIPARGFGGAKSGFDVTVIAAQRKGDCGTETLNAKLQAVLNPERDGASSVYIGRGQQARSGDVVKQFKNNNTLMVFNGEVGRVIAVDRSGKVLDAPRFAGATLLVPNGARTGRAANKTGHRTTAYKFVDTGASGQYGAPATKLQAVLIEGDGAQAKADAEGLLAPVKSVYASVEDNHVLVAEFPGVVKGTVRYIAYTKQEVQKLELGYALTVHACVTPGTLVGTPEGLLRMNELKSTGVIETPLGARAYTNLYRSEKKTKMLQITTRSGYSLTVTVNHGLDSWTGSDYTRVLGADIKVGDWLRFRRGWSLPLQDAAIHKPVPGLDSRTVTYRIPTAWTPELAELLGIICANGVLYGHGRRESGLAGGLRVTSAHEAIALRTQTLIEQLFGAPVKVDSYQRPLPGRVTTLGAITYRAECCSTQIASWLEAFGGLSPHKKDIPVAVRRSGQQVQTAFLRGLFSDGTVNLKKVGTAVVFDHIEWSNKTISVVATVRTMLLSLGIISGCTPKRPECLYIYPESAQRYRDLIGFIEPFKQNRLEKIESAYTRYSAPITRVELDTLGRKQLPSGALDCYSKGRASYTMLRRLSVAQPTDTSAQTEVRAALAERLNWHHDRVVSISIVEDFPMCVTVPDGHRFLQNGCSGWNSQGSTFRCVVFAVPNQHAFSLTRANVYTAVTRTSDYLCIVGEPESITNSLSNTRDKSRKTRLCGLLREAFAVEPTATVDRRKAIIVDDFDDATGGESFDNGMES